jgi:hypothetical protein
MALWWHLLYVIARLHPWIVRMNFQEKQGPAHERRVAADTSVRLHLRRAGPRPPALHGVKSRLGSQQLLAVS